MEYFVIKMKPGVPYYEGTKSLDGNPYKFLFYWNTYTSKWYLSMTSLIDATVTLRGVALLPGVDFLAKSGHGAVLGEMYLVDTSGAFEDPTYEEMGDRWELRYFPRV